MTQEEEETLDINLKILGNSELVQIPLPNNITIDSIKILAADYTDIPIDKMRLILTGRAMRNGTTLKDYDVHNGSTIHIVPERERPRSHQNPPPPQPQAQQNTESQQQQNQPQPPPVDEPQQQPQPQPQQRTFPTPSRDLTELRTAVSNVQQRLSEVSFAAASLQRAINQSSVGSSNEALNTLCTRFLESYHQLLELNNQISSFHAQNPEDNNNELSFSVNEPDALSTFQNDFMFGFNGILNTFMGQHNNIVLDPPERNNSQTSNPTVIPPANSNQNSESTSTAVEQSNTTTTTTTTTYSTSFAIDPSTNQSINLSNPQVQSASISGSYQGEIAPGVQAMVDVQVVNDQDGIEDENDEAIIEVNDVNIDLNNLASLNQNLNPNTNTTTTIETSDSGNTTITTTSTTTTTATEQNTDTTSSTNNNQQNEQQPQTQPSEPPVEQEEEVDLSQIVLDPEEIQIVNADAAQLRNNFEPPVLTLDYFRQHNTSL